MNPKNNLGGPSHTASLCVERHYKASPERVFGLLREPEHFARFLRAPCDKDCQEPASVVFEVGGRFKVPMLWTHGKVEASGIFTEIVPQRRIAFEFRWSGTKHFDNIGDTVVTIDLEPKDGGTWMTLTHAGFTSISARDEHRYGWSACMGMIASILAGAK